MTLRYRHIALVLAVTFLTGCSSMSSGLGHFSRTTHPGQASEPAPVAIELEGVTPPVSEEEEPEEAPEPVRERAVQDEAIIFAIVAGGLSLFLAGIFVGVGR